MTTDAWTAIRDRFARVLSRDRGREESVVAGELDQVRDEVVVAAGAGDEDEILGARDEWQRRMRRALAANPEAAADLREILRELEEPQGQPGSVSYVVNNTINEGTFSDVVIQTGSVGKFQNRRQ
ncbi:hypothetical protein [Streptomyces sp. KL116D]|uniref:hypothetical protein n=1 Tax=Streptomyces sp. KL116D TaxID=3045152 RepID=UPI003558A463